MKKLDLMEHFSGLNSEKLKEEKKRAVSHCLNLECKKEQLLILIEKLSTISGQRLGLFLNTHGAKESSGSFGFKKSSISDELKFAEESKNIIDIEIKNVKHQLKIIEKVLKNQ